MELITLPGKVYEDRNKTDAVSRITLIEGYSRQWAYLGEYIQNHVSGLATIPDEMRWSVNPHLLKAASRQICQSKGKYDLIATLSFPLSCHLVGERLRRQFGLPWIALFYDPWMDNPYRHHPSRLFEKMDARLERKVALAADACVFTNQTMADIWQRKYNGCRTFILPFCYTKEMMGSHAEFSDKQDCGEVRMLYAGMSNEQRNLQDLIMAVGELSSEHCPDINKLKVSVVGNVFEPDKALVEAQGLQQFFSFTGVHSQEQLKEDYHEADVFLVVDAPGSVNVHFPSKLMDYLYYRHPILGITPETGGTADILRASGNTVVRNGDIPALKTYIKKLLVGGSGSLSFDADYYRQFAPERVSERFVKIVNTIL